MSSLKAFTSETLQKFINAIHRDIVKQSLEYDIDAENAKIGIKKKSELSFSYTDSLIGKHGANVSDIQYDQATDEYVFTITDESIASAVPIDAPIVSTETIESSTINVTLQPNVFYTLEDVSLLQVTLAPPTMEGAYSEYMIQFTTGKFQPIVAWDNDIQFIGGEPTYKANMIYQVSILNGIGIIVGAPVPVTT